MLRNKTRSFDYVLYQFGIQFSFLIYQLKRKLTQIFVWPTSSTGCQYHFEIFCQGIFSRVSL